MDKREWNTCLKPYVEKSNAIALWQLLSTFALYVGLWVLYVKTSTISPFLVIPFAIVMAFFVLRFFVLMHDCGHGALFDSPRLNQFVGYLLGVITGMPQYVWSKHHAHHHATNGDWEKYRGPLTIASIEEYNSMSASQQRWYRVFRHPFSYVFIGGFLYVLFNPRFNWLVGLIKLTCKVIYTGIFDSPKKAWLMVKECPSKKWKTPREFCHMTYNNLTLLVIWYLMIQSLGAYTFFSVYAMSLSLAGGIGILFFTAQHNFENAYAVDTKSVCNIRASIDGTSYLKLPAILNWFTADIGYHHIHHLSTAVPNYRLADCHYALEEHFVRVKRIRMGEILHSVKHLLWDKDKEVIVTF